MQNEQKGAYDAGVSVYDVEGLQKNEVTLLKRYFTSGRILDVGCGTGRTTTILHQNGVEVEGIDYSANMIERAKEKYPGLTFKVMDVTKLDYPDASFDGVFCSFNIMDVLLSKESRTQGFKELYRVLKPGGIMAYSSHNAFAIPPSWTKFKRILDSFKAGYIWPYRQEVHPFGTIVLYYAPPCLQKREMKRNGFEPIEMISYTSKYPWLATFRDVYPTYVARKPAV